MTCNSHQISSFSLEREGCRITSAPDLELPIFRLFNDKCKQEIEKIEDFEESANEIKKLIEYKEDVDSLRDLVKIFCSTKNEENHKIIFKVFFDMLISPLNYTSTQALKRHRANSDEFGSIDNNSTGKRIWVRSTSFNLKSSSPQMLDLKNDKKECSLQYFLKRLSLIYSFSTEEERDFIVQILPSVLLSLTPTSAYVTKKEIPNYDIYTLVAQAICELVPLMKEEYINIFLKLLIDTSFIIIYNVYDYSLSSNSDPRNFVRYIGDLLPIIAECIPSATNGSELERSLQGFWIALVVQSGGDVLSVFTKWKDSILKLSLRTKPFISFFKSESYAEVTSLLNDIQNRIKQHLFISADEVAIIFKNLIPQINSTLVSLLSISDAVFVLSVFSLEKIRAMNGCFDQFINYCDVDYGATLNQCIDAMAEPVFSCFIANIHSKDDEEKANAILSLALTLLGGFLTHGSRRAKLTYLISPKFFKANTMCILSHDFMEALLNTAMSIDKAIQPLFYEIAREIVSSAAYSAPKLLFASASRIIIDKMTSSTSFCLYFFMELIPQKQRNKFLETYSKLCITHGMGFCMPDTIPECDNERKAEFVTLKIIKEKDPSLIKDIPSDIKIEAALRCWSTIATTSISLAKEVVHFLFKRFSTMISESKGLFSDVYNEVEVREETSILVFLTYMLKLNVFTKKIAPLASLMCNNKVVLKSAGAITALIPLANFMLSVISNKKMIDTSRDSNIIFTLTVLLKVLSMRSIPDVYKFVSPKELILFDIIIPQINKLPEVFEKTIELQTPEFQEVIKLDSVLFGKLINVLKYLLAQENMLFDIFVSPTKSHKNATNLINQNWVKPSHFYVNELLPVLLTLEPASIVSFIQILHAQPIFQQELPILNQRFPWQLASEPGLIPDLANNCVSSLSMAPVIEPQYAITLVKPSLVRDRFASKFIVRCLNRLPEEDALLIVPQLMQSIKFDEANAMKNFVISYAQTHEIFAHRVLWIISDEKSKNKSNVQYIAVLNKLDENINANFTEEQIIRKKNEFDFIDNLDEISKNLLKMKIEDRKHALIESLKTTTLKEGLYVPSRPEYEILSINPESSRPLKSHSRVPILVDFKVKDKQNNTFNYACIFKIQDDVRMDALMIQLIDKFDEIFKASGIDTFLCPYKVFTTGGDRGVIECIEHASSRHDIGAETRVPLLQYFTMKYGAIGTPSFCKAQQNFIKSLAPYSLICYIFQVKDRHNANIMIDEEGHVIHIDFGFIFDISPGGNIKFERAPFKLTREYIDLLGGCREAAPFQQFVSLLLKCFVAIQARHSEIEAICELMTNAGLPCFRPDSLRKLRERFAVDRSASEIPDYVNSLVNGSFESLTTSAYDSFQNAQNGIYY